MLLFLKRVTLYKLSRIYIWYPFFVENFPSFLILPNSYFFILSFKHWFIILKRNVAVLIKLSICFAFLVHRVLYTNEFYNLFKVILYNTILCTSPSILNSQYLESNYLCKSLYWEFREYKIETLFSFLKSWV